MKTIKIISTIFSLCYLISCTPDTAGDATSNTTDSTTTEAVQMAVELVEKVEYNEDSTFKMMYQVDKNTGAKYGAYKEYEVATSTVVAERNYKNNKLEGTEKIYFPSGQVDGEFTYKNGIHDGVFKYYYEDGTLKQEGTYVDGKIEGVLNSYYPTGTLKEEVAHKNGLTQGAFKEYNENGTLRAEGKYTSKSGGEDLEEGLLKMYDENGVLTRKMVCKEGQCCTTWTIEDGDIKSTTKLCDAILNNEAAE